MRGMAEVADGFCERLAHDRVVVDDQEGKEVRWELLQDLGKTRNLNNIVEQDHRAIKRSWGAP